MTSEMTLMTPQPVAVCRCPAVFYAMHNFDFTAVSTTLEVLLNDALEARYTVYTK